MAAQLWGKLPSIIIVEILSYLSLTDRLNATTTCRRWRGCLFHPLLWRSITFKVKNGGRRRAKHLADMCGNFVREAVIIFNSRHSGDVRECLRILDFFGENTNLERLVLKPFSCRVEWPDRETRDGRDLCIDALREVIRSARRLKHLSLGCIGELVDHTDSLLPLLAQHQASNIETLHLASVKEDPDSYGLINFPANHLRGFNNLRELGIDFDYLNRGLLEVFLQKRRATLDKLIIHLHGIEPGYEKIPNSLWQQVVQANPNLKVTLNLIHSIDGATKLLDILQPAMPLAHLRMFFCQKVSVASITFISQHMSANLQSVHIIDGMVDIMPNMYDTIPEEDPFVMMAWKCPNLTKLTLIGYNITDDDVVAIARLRGSQLKTLDVPLCCISSIEEDGDQVWVAQGVVGPDFDSSISSSLGRDWQPMADYRLHPAVFDCRADAETAYLSLLHNDQACW